jgi:hypothetical protein
MTLSFLERLRLVSEPDLVDVQYRVCYDDKLVRIARHPN